MFDPESVKRVTARWESGPPSERMTWTEDFVSASDYDSLLKLYREAALKTDSEDDLNWHDSLRDKISCRAANILWHNEITKAKFIQMKPLELRKLRNCGVITVLELAKLAHDIGHPLQYGRAIWDASAKQKQELKQLCV